MDKASLLFLGDTASEQVSFFFASSSLLSHCPLSSRCRTSVVDVVFGVGLLMISSLHFDVWFSEWSLSQREASLMRYESYTVNLRNGVQNVVRSCADLVKWKCSTL